MPGKSWGGHAFCLSYSHEALIVLFWGCLGAVVKKTEQLRFRQRGHLSESGLIFGHLLTCFCICWGLTASLRNDPFVADYLGVLSALMVSWKTIGCKPPS